MSDYDYSSAGYYFITICCMDRIHHFGKISNGKMVLSEIGAKAFEFWLEIPLHFKCVKPDEFVIMPNHVHGILILQDAPTGTCHGMSPPTTNNNMAGSCHGMSLYQKNINRFSKPVKNSVSVIINQYKSSVKRWCNKNGFRTFRWQSRFHERILFDLDSIEKTREYINLNPINWPTGDQGQPDPVKYGKEEKSSRY